MHLMNHKRRLMGIFPTFTEERIRKLFDFLPYVAGVLCLLRCPKMHWLVIGLAETMFTSIFIGYVTLMYGYYKALPACKKTTLTYLFKDLLVSIAIIRLLHFIRNVFLTLFVTPMMVNYIEEFPIVSCSLLSSSPFRLFGLNFISIICSVQTFAKLKPGAYLSMNHERVRKVAIFVNFFIVTLEIRVTLYMYNTLCTYVDKTLVEEFLEIHLDTTGINISVFHICSIILAILTKFLCWLATYHFKSTRASKKKPIIKEYPSQRIFSIRLQQQSKVTTVDDVIIENLDTLTVSNQNPIPFSVSHNNNVLIKEGESESFGSQQLGINEAIEQLSSPAINPQAFPTNSINIPIFPNSIPLPIVSFQRSFIFDSNMPIALNFIFLIAIMIFVLLTSSSFWWITTYVKELVIIVAMYYWMYTSKPVYEFSVRKIIQLVGQNSI